MQLHEECAVDSEDTAIKHPPYLLQRSPVPSSTSSLRSCRTARPAQCARAQHAMGVEYAPPARRLPRVHGCRRCTAGFSQSGRRGRRGAQPDEVSVSRGGRWGNGGGQWRWWCGCCCGRAPPPTGLCAGPRWSETNKSWKKVRGPTDFFLLFFFFFCLLQGW